MELGVLFPKLVTSQGCVSLQRKGGEGNVRDGTGEGQAEIFVSRGFLLMGINVGIVCCTWLAAWRSKCALRWDEEVETGEVGGFYIEIISVISTSHSMTLLHSFPSRDESWPEFQGRSQLPRPLAWHRQKLYADPFSEARAARSSSCQQRANSRGPYIITPPAA